MFVEHVFVASCYLRILIELLCGCLGIMRGFLEAPCQGIKIFL
jgi:hypothetical protein